MFDYSRKDILLLKKEPSFERSQIKNVTIESNKNKKEREEKMRMKMRMKK